MPKTITVRDGDPDIIGEACCPRCGAAVRPVKRIYNNHDTIGDRETVGYRVRHEDTDAKCNRREWPIYDPGALDGELGLPTMPEDVGENGGGLSICRTCLTNTQHIEHANHSDDVDEGFAVVDPTRDDDGDVICFHCRKRTRGY